MIELEILRQIAFPMAEVVRSFWLKDNLIPLGTKQPYWEYKKENGKYQVPINEIVTLRYDPVDLPVTKRKAFNLMFLGRSGDGKSLLMKQIWSILYQAGYYVCYFDPKSMDSGRAKLAWDHPRLCPGMKPKGIPLEHYMPSFSLKDFEHYSHHFKKYSLRLQDVSEKEMWMGQNVSVNGALQISSLIEDEGVESVPELITRLGGLREANEFHSSSFTSVNARLKVMEKNQMFDTSIPELDLLNVWKSNKSICISYNSKGIIDVSFDVGEKIRKASRYYFKGNKTPKFFFLDDASYVCDPDEGPKFNYAVNEIKNIAHNYRTLGVSGGIALQDFKIVSKKIIDGFPYVFVSSKFKDLDGVKRIGVDSYIVENFRQVRSDPTKKDKYTMPWLIYRSSIEEEGDRLWDIFYPFPPPCDHFTDIYPPKTYDETGKVQET